jgi:hypothetical protein
MIKPLLPTLTSLEVGLLLRVEVGDVIGGAEYKPMCFTITGLPLVVAFKNGGGGISSVGGCTERDGEAKEEEVTTAFGVGGSTAAPSTPKSAAATEFGAATPNSLGKGLTTTSLSFASSFENSTSAVHIRRL